MSYAVYNFPGLSLFAASNVPVGTVNAAISALVLPVKGLLMSLWHLIYKGDMYILNTRRFLQVRSGS